MEVLLERKLKVEYKRTQKSYIDDENDDIINE
jgi:hypothetical protein